MTERLEPSPIKESVDNQVSRALVIMFPDSRTADGFRRDYQQYYKGTLAEEFLITTDKLIKRYKRERYKIFGVIYEDTFFDPGYFSGLYPKDAFDELISIGTTLNEWTRESFKAKLPNLIGAMNLKQEARVVVGGYHAKDCVAQMAARLRDFGHLGVVDLLLTDELPFLLVSHRIRKALGKEATKALLSK